MSKFLNIALMICLGICTASVSASAQSVGKSAKGGPAATEASAKSSASTTTATTIDELLGLLPASDAVAVVDAGRAFNDLLPRLANLNIGEVDKIVKEIQEFTSKTGIDPSKAQSAVLGFRMNGKQANGAAIIYGLDVDDKKIEAAMKAYKADYKALDYKGKPIYSWAAKAKAPSAGPVSVKTDETAIASLGQQKIVLGDLNAVKSVIDIQTGTAKGGVTSSMVAALKETRESALVRFTLSIPENLRQEASNQGDLFKSVASIKMILGTLDTASDLSISLDTILRTASQTEAADLESGLKGLVSLVRGFLSGGDPKLDIFGQLLDQVKIGSKQNDVSLSFTVPRSLMDQLSKKSTTEPKKQ